MDHKNLAIVIKSLSQNVTTDDVSALINVAVYRELKKGELLLKEGEACRAFYFVEKGYLRTYYNKDGAEVNLNFTFENNFTTNLKSIKSKKGSEVNIEAGENASIWVFSLNGNQSPVFLSFLRRMVVQLLLAADEHTNLFKLYTPTERYRQIEKNNPQLLQRISLTQIASYLGVTRETLSRIRAKTA